MQREVVETAARLMPPSGASSTSSLCCHVLPCPFPGGSCKQLAFVEASSVRALASLGEHEQCDRHSPMREGWDRGK